MPSNNSQIELHSLSLLEQFASACGEQLVLGDAEHATGRVIQALHEVEGEHRRGEVRVGRRHVVCNCVLGKKPELRADAVVFKNVVGGTVMFSIFMGFIDIDTMQLLPSLKSTGGALHFVNITLNLLTEKFILLND